MICKVCGDISNDISRFRAPDLCNRCFKYNISNENKNAIKESFPEEKLNEWRQNTIQDDNFNKFNEEPPKNINMFALTDRLLAGFIQFAIGIILLNLKIEITGFLFKDSISLFDDNTGPKIFYILIILISSGLIINGIVNIYSNIKKLAISLQILSGKK